MATENKSLKYFMRPVQQEIIAFTGPESFKDDDGNPINFEAKILTQQEITRSTKTTVAAASPPTRRAIPS